ncbi:hypothetical protein ACHWQZ_G009211 [Mnemiopsis leidyi]
MKKTDDHAFLSFPLSPFHNSTRRDVLTATDEKTNYITTNFSRRECNKFVPKSASPQDEELCKCGNHLTDHKDEIQQCTYTVDWDPILDTVLCPTNAYGELDFAITDNDVFPVPRYLRCQNDVEIEKLGDLFLKRWAIPSPNLLISVFGGHSKFDSKKLPTVATIKEGLVKAAKDTKAWLFTSGVDNGVSSLVGEAVASKRSFVNYIPVIGVNSWGAVYDNKELIEKPDEQGKFSAVYKSVPLSELNRYPVTNAPTSMCLEQNHTHFILLDFGTKNDFHETQVRDFRIKLQEHIQKKSVAQLVSVLIEGGRGSLEEAHMKIRKRIPIVILGDTGRISNVLSNAVDMARDTKNAADGGGAAYNGQNDGTLKNDDRLRIRESLTQVLPDYDDSEYDKMMEEIEEIVSHKDLVTVWRHGKGVDLDTAILEGLIKSIKYLLTDINEQRPLRSRSSTLDQRIIKKQRKAKDLLKKQLRLTIQWDRSDIAKRHIFDVETNFTNIELNNLLEFAIKQKKTSFVEQFIELGANIKSYLTVERFERMLQKNTPKKSHLYELLSKKCENPKNWKFEHFEMIIHDISEGVFKIPGKTKPSETTSSEGLSGENKIFQAVKKCFTSCCEGCRSVFKPSPRGDETETFRLEEGNQTSDSEASECSGRPDRNYEFKDPASLLTVYMVMIHEQEMAEVLWQYSQTSLFLSLVCTCLHNWMYSKRLDTIYISDGLGENLQSYSKKFVDIAYGVLDEVSKCENEHVVTLVNFKFDEWGGRTILEMADYIDAIELIAHPTIQDYIDVEWNGWLNPDMSTVRTIMSLPCPFLASFRKYTSNDHRKRKNVKDSKKKSRNRRQAFIENSENSTEPDDTDKMQLDALTKCKYFYKAPLIKFWIYTIMYGWFLFAYICALLLRGDAENCKSEDTFRMIFRCRLTVPQALTYIWVFSLIPLEIRQFYFSYPSTIRGKLKMYFANNHNKSDALSILMIVVALFFKMSTDRVEGQNQDMTFNENAFRLLFAFAFVLFCLRLWQASEKSEQIGPKVMMMKKMLNDLQFFIFLVLLVVIAYGVSTASIMNPQKFETFSKSSDTVFDMFWRPYQNMFGEIADADISKVMSRSYCILDNRKLEWNKSTEMYSYSWNETFCEEDYSCSKDKNSICEVNIYVVRILLALYMMFAAVLMLNLMVAVFTNTYENIQEKYKAHWKYQKFELMIEYRSRSPLPVPFSTVLHLIRFVILVIRTSCKLLGWCCVETERENNEDTHQRFTIIHLENECRRHFIEKKKKKTDNDILVSNISQLISSEVGHIDKRFEHFETKVQKVIDSAQPQFSRQNSTLQLQDSVSLDDIWNAESMNVNLNRNSQCMAAIKEEGLGEMPGRIRRISSSAVSWKSQHLSKIIKNSKLSRKLKYPGEKNIRRLNIKAEYWDWGKLLINYEPAEYTDPSVCGEKKLSEIKWNSNFEGDERRSYGEKYKIENELPLNPCGRTGLSGRGLLEKFGPNHVILPIITRTRERGEEGHELEVLLDCRMEESWCLPEFKGAFNDSLPQKVYELLTSTELLLEDISSGKLEKRIRSIVKAGILIHKGFLDSEYNTDNSWLEGMVISYHDVKDHVLPHISFPEESDYRWKKIVHWSKISEPDRHYVRKAFFARGAELDLDDPNFLSS